MSFRTSFQNYSWDEVTQTVAQKTTSDVERALKKNSSRSLEDFMALISPAASPYLEEMAQLSRELTRKRFGNTIQLYIPMYVSNECTNICTYCGFSLGNKIPRRTLAIPEVLKEVKVIKSYGFDHVLLVSGESHRHVGIDYFDEVVRAIRPHFSHITIEFQPLETEEYQRLIECGVHSVLVYQETYHVENYRQYHPKGKKSNFWHRLDTPDRLGQAGIHKIGLGALIGLEDWRTDAWFTALHLNYLRNRYWRTKYSISFPRLRPAEGYQEPKSVMNDRELVQLICAYRLFDENVELSLSTRESAHFRDNALQIGITTMSAGSKTDPGGYAQEVRALEQFTTSDERSAAQVAHAIRERGYEPVWKDWDTTLTGKAA